MGGANRFNKIIVNMGKYFCLITFVVASVMIGCSGGDATRSAVHQDDSICRQTVMSIYAYQPERALHILDSAVAAGSISAWRADIYRMRIYSSTLMHEQMDSLLGGAKDAGYDSARAIGERMLSHDSVQASLKWQLDILEMLSYTARMQNDTTQWLRRARQFVTICRQIGDSQTTNALRTEAEIGAALCVMGQRDQGMAKLDSAIYQLEASFHREHDAGRFAELDALIIALKRKIVQLASNDRNAETLPLARLIIERLDDYEKHPDRYHDGTYREPKTAEKRTDYIRFYRSQAQGYITAAYASLGESGNMLEAFTKIEKGVHEATAREHIARYNALQQQMEAERQHTIADKARLTTLATAVFALLLLVTLCVIGFHYRAIGRKNRHLAQQITEAMKYKELYSQMLSRQDPIPVADNNDSSTLSDEQFFAYVQDVILSERLYLDPNFGRQTIMDRFQLSKERVGILFSKFSNHPKLSNYVTSLRLEYAAQLLVRQPNMNIVAIATQCGFSSMAYFSTCFRRHYGMSPSDFRSGALAANQ